MKKFLSLVLALAMTLSLVTISAGAKDFADDSDIEYKEAVDVISALGVVSGYGDNSFRPDGLLTRGAAAKIICNLILGPTTAGALSASSAPFKDVPTDNVFAGYITYCAQQGIISGYGDGTFRPTGSLTGNAFMKMLLGALGYSSSIEGYTGANWQVNVVKQAIGIGLDDGNDDFVGSQPVTRGEAALYAFNMLQATMVEYDNQSTIVVGDIQISTSSARDEIPNSGNETIDGDKKMQFAERYFPKLEKRDSNRTDDFGRPAVTWVYDRDTVGTYAKEADAVYTDKVKVSDIYADLDLSARTTADVTIDGVGNETDSDLNITSGSVTLTKNGSTKIGGPGVLTEAFVDDDENVEIVMIKTYVGEVARVMTEDDVDDDEKPYIEIDGLTGIGGEFETTAFDEDDVVLYTVADGEVQSVELAEPVSDQELTSTTGSPVTEFRAGGEKYEYNVENAGQSDVKLDDSIDIYLDSYGYVVYVKLNEAGAGNTAFVLGLDHDTDRFDSSSHIHAAKLLLLDGTEVIADLEDTNSGTSYDEFKNKFVSYTVDDDEIYTLSLKDKTDSNTSFSTPGVKITKGTSKFDMNGTSNSGGDRYANNSTIFLVYDSDEKEYSVYTGIDNVPSMDGNATVYVNSKTGGGNSVAKVVFITGKSSVVSNDAKTLAYIVADSESKLVDDTDLGKYYTYDAIVDGEITTVDIAQSKKLTGDVLASNLTTNSKGIVTGYSTYTTDSSKDEYAVISAGTMKTTDGTVGLKNTYYTYSDDVEVFRIDGDKIRSVSVTSIRDDGNDKFAAVVKDGEVIAIFITVVDGADQAGQLQNVVESAIDDITDFKDGSGLESVDVSGKTITLEVSKDVNDSDIFDNLQKDENIQALMSSIKSVKVDNGSDESNVATALGQIKKAVNDKIPDAGAEAQTGSASVSVTVTMKDDSSVTYTVKINYDVPAKAE